jgi:hypothetical protein
MGSPFRRRLKVAAIVACVAGGSAARADELFGGIYVHDAGIGTQLIGGRDRLEHGTDFAAGWRGGSILPLLGGPQLHLTAIVNSAGNTNFAAAGISWKIGGRFFLRPGLGLGIHDGYVHPSVASTVNHRLPFGSRVLFEPELGIGARVAPRVSLEASWVHLSNASLLGHPNPGIDMLGMRMNFAFR